MFTKKFGRVLIMLLALVLLSGCVGNIEKKAVNQAIDLYLKALHENDIDLLSSAIYNQKIYYGLNELTAEEYMHEMRFYKRETMEIFGRTIIIKDDLAIVNSKLSFEWIFEDSDDAIFDLEIKLKKVNGKWYVYSIWEEW